LLPASKKDRELDTLLCCAYSVLFTVYVPDPGQV
jgi:hypothetical protein